MRPGQRLPRRTARIPLRMIERAYGRDNAEGAADDVVYALRTISSDPDEFPYRFEIDHSHANPWYHAMVFEVERMPDRDYERFIALLAGLGLVEETGKNGSPAR